MRAGCRRDERLAHHGRAQTTPAHALDLPPRTPAQSRSRARNGLRAMTQPTIGPARDKLLFTPGPLTTSTAVKAAMLHDVGSWHFEFNEIVQRIRERLLDVAGVSRADGWEA